MNTENFLETMVIVGNKQNILNIPSHRQYRRP